MASFYFNDVSEGFGHFAAVFFFAYICKVGKECSSLKFFLFS
jgi:hypothetical protein